MQTVEALKRQIESAEDLSTVVRTMKTLAAVSIRQYEEAVESLNDYFSTVETGLQIVLREAASSLPSDVFHDRHRTGAVVFGSDQGMCGQFNEQLVDHTLNHVRKSTVSTADWKFLVVGSRIAERLQDEGLQIDGYLPVAGSSTGITQVVQRLLVKIETLRHEAHLSRVLLFYNRRVSASSYRPHRYELLPLRPERFRRPQQRETSSRCLPTHRASADVLLSRLVRQYLFVGLFRACAESLAGENASRIASMQAADKNIQERLVQLRMNFNQQRQTAITEELLDVVTGFEALRSAR